MWLLLRKWWSTNHNNWIPAQIAIIKRTDAAASWFVFDSLRGWSSGADPYLLLDSNAAQDGAYDMGSAESNGFSLINDTNTNASGGSYIYYAHA